VGQSVEAGPTCQAEKTEEGEEGGEEVGRRREEGKKGTPGEGGRKEEGRET